VVYSLLLLPLLPFVMFYTIYIHLSKSTWWYQRFRVISYKKQGSTESKTQTSF
jgi:hypothetical protein